MTILRTFSYKTFGAFTALSMVAAGALTIAPSVNAAETTERYIVKVEETASISSQTEITNRAEQAVERLGGDVDERLDNVIDALIVDLPASKVAQLQADPNVQYVVKDSRVTIAGTGTQTSPPSWGIDRLDQKNLPTNNRYRYIASGENVRVYVFDTGVRSTHNTFGGRVTAGWTAYDDGNGTEDCNGHGTHVAGTVAGSTFGVAKNATIVPVRVLGCDGSGFVSDLITALDWVVDPVENAAGVGVPSVINMSLTAGVNTALDNAVSTMVNTHGISVIAAAGNNNLDACNYSPPRSPASLTVGATTSTDVRSSFSNFGTCVDIFAPGSSIFSASHLNDTGSTAKSGTSMAAPHVAGIYAQYLEIDPTYTPSDLKNLLISQATPNIVTSEGTGSPRLLARSLYSTTEAPTSVVANPGNGQATITWTAPAWDGADAITGYAVYRSVEGSGTYVTLTNSTGSTTTSYTATGLTNGVSYLFAVAAVNNAGTSEASEWSEAVTPFDPAVLPPVNDTSTVVEGESVLIDVIANDPNGSVLDTISTAPSVGTAVIEAGQIRYTAPLGALGTVTFQYRIVGTATTATVSVNVTAIPVPDPPVNDTANVIAGGSVAIDVLANDPAGATIQSVVDAPAEGTAIVSNGKILYTAPEDFTGTVTFTYRIVGSTAKATVTVTVGEAPPTESIIESTPVNDTATVDAGDSVLINVLANDPAGATLDTIVSAPSVGVAVIEGTQIRYTAPESGSGTDSFTYRINGSATTATVTVTINEATVTPPPTPPSSGGGGGGGGGGSSEPAPAPAPLAPVAATPTVPVTDPTGTVTPNDPVQEAVNTVLGLKPSDVQTLTGQQLGELPAEAWAVMSPAQVRALNPEQVTRFITREQVQQIPAESLRAMKPATLKMFKPWQLRAMTEEQAQQLRPAQIKKLGKLQKRIIMAKR